MTCITNIKFLNHTAELRNWSRDEYSDSYIYLGDIYGDKKGRWRDGTHIHTSKVVKQEEDEFGNILVTTLNSTYFLPREFKRKVVNKIGQSYDKTLG